MDGAFLELDAESVEGEVDEYNREIYKIQKVFNSRVKKLTMEVEDRNRERKKRRRYAEESGGEIADEDKDEIVHIPQAVNITNTVQDGMRDFKVCMMKWINKSI